MLICFDKRLQSHDNLYRSLQGYIRPWVIQGYIGLYRVIQGYIQGYIGLYRGYIGLFRVYIGVKGVRVRVRGYARAQFFSLVPRLNRPKAQISLGDPVNLILVASTVILESIHTVSPCKATIKYRGWASSHSHSSNDAQFLVISEATVNEQKSLWCAMI